MITDEEICNMEKLLKANKEFFMREKEERYLGRSKNNVDRLKEYLELHPKQGTYDEELNQFEYSSFISNLSSTFNITLIRWKVKEKNLLKNNLQKFVYRIKQYPMNLYMDKKNPYVEYELVTPSPIKVTNPSAIGLVKLLRSHELIRK